MEVTEQRRRPDNLGLRVDHHFGASSAQNHWDVETTDSDFYVPHELYRWVFDAMSCSLDAASLDALDRYCKFLRSGHVLVAKACRCGDVTPIIPVSVVASIVDPDRQMTLSRSYHCRRRVVCHARALHASLSSASLSSALRIRSFASSSSLICCSVFELLLRRLLVLAIRGAACLTRLLVGFGSKSNSEV